MAKLITFGENREMAIEKMQSALNDYPFLGVKNNRLYLKKTLGSKAFKKGDTWTNFIDKNPEILDNCQNRNVENELGVLCLNSEAISKTKPSRGSFDEVVASNFDLPGELQSFRN